MWLDNVKVCQSFGAVDLLPAEIRERAAESAQVRREMRAELIERINAAAGRDGIVFVFWVTLGRALKRAGLI